VTGLLVVITPEPSDAERRAIEIALEQAAEHRPRPQPASWAEVEVEPGSGA
jgi:hypothetical protein